MGRPTLYSKGSLVPLNSKVKKDELDNYIPIHYILNVCAYKMAKPMPNRHDRLLFLKAETGSGKTTVFPIELFRALWTRNTVIFGSAEEEKLAFRQMLPSDFSIFDFPDDPETIRNRKAGIAPVSKKQHYIGCTQPKTITAVEKAKENSDSKDYNPDIDIGKNTGYSTGNFKQRFTEPAGILYMTLGSLTQVAKSADASLRLMEKFDYIMIDECHERAVDLDLTVRLLLNILDANTGNVAMPMLIFMSATFDLEKFAAFFRTPKENAVYVIGESAKKTITYLTQPAKNYVTETVELVMRIHNVDGKDDPDHEKDILIFVNGSPDDRDIANAIREADKAREFIVLTVNSNNYNTDPQLIEILGKTTIQDAAKLANIPTATRRVTISTNVAETGLTIPTLKYVIETGWEKATYYSPIHGLSMLVPKPVTKSSSTQRCGRVGRKFYGYAFCMYTEEDFKRFEDYKIPDIYTSDLTKTMLELMYSGLPMDNAHRRLSTADFSNFIKKCSSCVTGTPSECNYIFNSIDNNMPFMDEHLLDDTFKVDEIIESEVATAVIASAAKRGTAAATGDRAHTHDNPPEMLDKITQDMYLIGRNKIISLGFYGNYAGYIASNISRLPVEGIRMIMASSVYGASLNDMVNIALLANAKSNDYLFSSMDEKRSKGRVKSFSIMNLIEDLISKDNLRRDYFGSPWNFVEMFYDDFIRALMIIRWMTLKARKSEPTKVQGLCDKMGINFVKLMKVLEPRKSIIDSFRDMGIVNMVPEIDFNGGDIINETCRIKKCIYSGYKNNIAYLRNGQYEANTGMKFSTKIFIKRKPEKIVYNSLMMMNKQKSIFYEVSADMVCSLDGII
jgi:hypothetical protein